MSDIITPEKVLQLWLDVKVLGRQKGYTQRYLAEKLEIDETVLSRMLSSDRGAAMKKHYAPLRALVDELRNE